MFLVKLQNPIPFLIQRIAFHPTVSARQSVLSLKCFSNSSSNQASTSRTNRGNRRKFNVEGTPGSALNTVFPSLAGAASPTGQFKDEFYLQRKPGRKIASQKSVLDLESSVENSLKKRQERHMQPSKKKLKLELLSQKRSNSQHLRLRNQRESVSVELEKAVSDGIADTSQASKTHLPYGIRVRKEHSYEDEEGKIAEAEDSEQFSPDYMPRVDESVLIVNTVDVAKSVVDKLCTELKHEVHACDTEVAGIDVKKDSPVGKGKLVCFSVYCGPNADLGGGRKRLWVDVHEKRDVLYEFKRYFEDASIKKVWHNYSFDRHILANEGIEPKGFHCDTMHLARLWNSSRKGKGGGYSLEALSKDSSALNGRKGRDVWLGENMPVQKTSMLELFGVRGTRKDGKERKSKTLPSIVDIHTDPEVRSAWIDYSAKDAVATYVVFCSLRRKLSCVEEYPWHYFVANDGGAAVQESGTQFDFYCKYWRPFGEVLIDIERRGMHVDRTHLAGIQTLAEQQRMAAEASFQDWARRYCRAAEFMNAGSDAQLRVLLYGGRRNRKNAELFLERERKFKVPNVDGFVEEGKKVAKKSKELLLTSLEVDLPALDFTPTGWPSINNKLFRALAGKVAFQFDLPGSESDSDASSTDSDVPDTSMDGSSDASVSSSVEDSEYGQAYRPFGGGSRGRAACHAFATLCERASIDTLLSNFIRPLQSGHWEGGDGRIHCSLNLNTETGRLSARKPSLQNQPAVEKDRYRIRQAFCAPPGSCLIVADYGQLELRLLAHLSGCRSMLEAFRSGGDFHSRTALNMYAHVREAVQRGEVLLEWDAALSQGPDPPPLLKERFRAERQKAKMLNFSIAYGKTAIGLAKDWNVSRTEAEDTVRLWYADRPEVEQWQRDRIAEAHATHKVHTLLGRPRHLPDIAATSPFVRSHNERAAINTPVQGSAADIAMLAMLRLHYHGPLKDLGFHLLLQVHDEVILEGPEEHGQAAQQMVVDCMERPFFSSDDWSVPCGHNPLSVDLVVDAKTASDWYSAK